MPQYKLVYFNLKGRAESARLIFAYAGVPYEDYRFKDGEWPEFKAKTPMGQVPVLEVDGKVLGQSMAINRYLAKGIIKILSKWFKMTKLMNEPEEFKLTGKDNWEAAVCDMMADGLSDVLSNLRPWFMEKDESKKKELMEKIKKEHLIPFCDFLEKTLAANGSGFYVGNSVTWIDLAVFAAEEWWSGMTPDVMDSHPKIKEHKAKIANLPNIKKWLETRPQTQM